MTLSRTPERSGRGCVFFSFGTGFALQLLVSIHSLRKYYDGPITVFLAPEKHGEALRRDIEKLGAEVAYLENLSRSCDRHRIFRESPYETTLSFDSDVIFRGPIDDLWEPLEREGVLVTRFYTPPYGIDGTKEAPGEVNRMELLGNLHGFVDEAAFERAVRRVKCDRTDINIGVLGISRPNGDAFLADWSRLMERGRDKSIPILDEVLVVALIDDYAHYQADEVWNCPADEFFRMTNIADAVILHYFGDGYRALGDQRMGRNARTWAGKKWYEAYYETAAVLDLTPWRRLDRKFDKRVERPFAHGFFLTFRNWLKDGELAIRSIRNTIQDRTYWSRFR